MKNFKTEDIRELRRRKKEKKLTTRESKKFAKLKVWVSWFIVIAFVLTSGVLVAGIGNFFTKKPTPQATKKFNPQDVVQKRLEADVKYWTKKIEEEPNNPHNYFNLGDSYQRAGEFEKATEYFKKAVELDPTAVMYRKYLALSYEATGKTDEAKKVIEEALAQKEDDSLYAALGRIYYREKKLPKALEYFKKAVKKNPGQGIYYVFVAKTQQDMGDKKGAIKTLKEGIEVAKTMKDRQSLSIMASMLFQLEKPKETKQPNEAKNEEKAPNNTATETQAP